jgi:hypothetical protein
MPASKDWLAQDHEGLFNQAGQTRDYLSIPANQKRMGIEGNILAWVNNNFKPRHDSFTSAYNQWRDPEERSPVRTRELFAAEKAFKPCYRKLYSGFLRENPLVTATDLRAMGLPARNTKRVPARVATIAPYLRVNTRVPRNVIIHFSGKEDRSKAKPAGQRGVEIRWAILPAPPATIDELVNTSSSTRSPFTLDFPDDQRGRLLYLATRWVNTRGEKGPWGESTMTIIP